MKEHLKILGKEHKWLVPLLLITTFSFGYQAVPFFVWFYVPALLLYTRNKSSHHITYAYLVTSVGLSLGYIGNFKTTIEGPRFPLAWLSAAAAFLENTLLIFALLADRYVIRNTKCIYTRVLTFPCVWTGLWFISGRFGPLGDYPAFSTALIQWADFSQIASFGGRALLDFLIALTGTVIFELPSYPLHVLTADNSTTLLANSTVEESEELQHDNHATIPLRKRQCIQLLLHPVTIYSFIMALVFTIGGVAVNIRHGSFYQVTYPEYIPKTTPVGCVVGPTEVYLDLRKNHDVWFNKTVELAEAGARIVLWSELTAVVVDEEDEKVFIERTKELALKHKIYIGATYALLEPVAKNKLVVVTKEGNIGIDYNKAHPVPGVETQPAGPNVLQFLDTEEFGRIGGGICFDYNFADFIGQASTHKVDLMLQPSWTWGPIGTHHQQGNILRAVENGFTLFRCVSQGVSGIYEPTLNGLFNQKVASNNVEQYIFNLPLQKRVSTLYGYIGESFAYISIIASGALLFNAYRYSKKQITI